MIFDEIDRGVGGAVASAVGERLHRLAEARPGARRHPLARRSPRAAPRHLLIEKSHDGLVTRTGVQRLDEGRRREEIARMLSGAAGHRRGAGAGDPAAGGGVMAEATRSWAGQAGAMLLIGMAGCSC